MILFFTAVACKEEKKETVELETVETPEVVEETLDFPKLEGVPQSVNYIFEDGYLYSPTIQIDEIASYQTEDNTFNFVIYLNKDTDLEELQKLTLGLILYPKDLSVLKTAKQKKTKSIGKGYSTEIYILDNSPVISVKDFKVATNDFNLMKVYFYSKEAGVLNDKTLRISNFTL
ncbi:MAG: hypothetical protein BM549_02735 [Lacinutrix sp. MedPE-SW]|nr:MAG: hypothetical protein BM549_02735 [Lacinutrix sp. MedPE-SW]